MDERQNILSRAQSAIISRDFPLATKLYKSILKEHPKDIEVLKSLGAMYIKAGQDEKALETYKLVEAIDRKESETLIVLGGIYRRLGRYEESIAVLENAIAYGHSNAEVYYNLGFTYKLSGNLDGAIMCFENVIEENPMDALTFNHLGSIYAMKGDYRKAVETYLAGLKVDHNHPILHFNLAQAYEKLKKVDYALSEYEAALRSKPLWHEAIERYTDLLLKTNNIQTAQDVVENAVRLDPNNSKMHTQLGEVFMKQYDWDNAKDAYGEALELDEENIKAKIGLASSSENLGDYDASVELMGSVVKSQKDNADYERQYIGTLLSAKYYDAAKAELDEIINKDSENPDNLNLLAQYYVCVGNDREADEVVKKIELKNPAYSKHLRDVGIRSNQIGKSEFAEKYLSTYLEKHPDDAKAVFEMAKTCESLEDFEKALDYYNKSLSLESYNIQAKRGVSGVKKVVEVKRAEAEKIPQMQNDQAESEISFDDDMLNEEVLPQAGSVPEDEASETREESPVEPEVSDKNIRESDAGVEDGMEETESAAELSEVEVRSENFPVDFSAEENLEEPDADELDYNPFEEQNEETADAGDDEFFNGDDIFEEADDASEDESKPEESEILENEILDGDAFDKDIFEDFDIPDFHESEIENDGSPESVPAEHESEAEEPEQEISEPESADAEEEMTVSQSDGENKALEMAKKAMEMAENALQATENLAEQLNNLEKEETEAAEETETIEETADCGPSEEAEPAETSENSDSENEESEITVSEAITEIKNDLTDSETYSKFAGTLDVFKKLRSLIEYLPEEKKLQFLKSETRVKMDYVISKMSGTPGLFITSDTLRGSGILKNIRTSDEDKTEFSFEKAEKTLESMKSYIECLKDENLAEALKNTLNNSLEKVKISAL